MKIDLSPSFISKISTLSLRVKTIADGTICGQHKARSKGNSLEFYEHKEYHPMDEPKYIDWKLFARKEKLYLKSYTDEISLNINVILDISRSMDYPEKGVKKIDLAVNLAASILYFSLMQNDYFGLTLFNEGVLSSCPPSTGEQHLRHLFEIMETLKCSGGTDTETACRQFAGKGGRRSLTVLISDLMDRTEKVLSAEKLLFAVKSDLIVFQALDRTEIELPSGRRFIVEDMETGETVEADIPALKSSYSEIFSKKFGRIAEFLASRNADFVRFITDEPYDVPLAAYLSRRQRWSPK